MINTTSLKFIFGFLVMIASSLMLVTAAAYYEQVSAVKSGTEGYCAPGIACK